VSDVDLILYSPVLVLGLFVALVLALAAVGWLLMGRMELRARFATEKAAFDAAFAQLTATDAALGKRRDLLEAALAALPAGVEVRDGAGQVLLRNPHALAFGAPFGEGSRLAEMERLADGRMLDIRRATLPNGAIVAVGFEVSTRLPTAPPLPAPPMRRGQEPIRSLPGLPPRGRRALVLLVEDIPVNQVVTATALQRAGHHVDIAASGAAAVLQVTRAPYEIVLMDLMMPGMSGFEAARAIRALPGPAGDVPIYALTATASQTDRTRCHDAGMQGMLTKPVQAEDMAEILAGILQPARGRTGQAPPAAADRLLDAVRLAELQRGLPAGMFLELVEQALGDMEARLGSLQAALAEDDAAILVMEAHALAGMAGNYGLLAFDAQMRAVLAAASGGDVAGARRAADGMMAALDASAAALRAMLRSTAASTSAAT